MSAAPLSWEQFGGCHKAGCVCGKFFPAEMQRNNKQPPPTGFLLYGIICICGCPGNIHNFSPASAGTTTNKPPSPPPPNPTGDAPPTTSASTSSGQKFSSFMQTAKDRKQRQQDGIASSIPKFDPSMPVGVLDSYVIQFEVANTLFIPDIPGFAHQSQRWGS